MYAAPRRGRSAARWCRGAVGLALVLAGGLSLSAGPALASQTHLYQSQFGFFGSPQGIAIDKAGDTYVLDASGQTVSKFNASNEPVEFEPGVIANIEGVGAGASPGEDQIAVDNTSGPEAGDIYVATGTTVKIFSPEGATLGELTPEGLACGVVVDAMGHVYVGISPNGTTVLAPLIDEYTPKAKPVGNSELKSSLEAEGLSEICNVAVDSAGSVYATNRSNTGVTKFTASQFGAGPATGTLVAESGGAVAVDSADDVYVDQGSQVVQYDSTGKIVNTISGPAGEPFAESHAVAVNAGGQVFVADNSRTRVDVFGPLVTLPDETTSEASEIQTTGATLNGSVNPDGEATTYQFEYGTSTSYGSFAPASPASAGSGNSAVPVSATVTGLAAQTTYHFRIVASNTNGTTDGADETFTTLGPVASIAAATGISNASATLNGSVDVRGLPNATYRFTVTSSTSPYEGSTPETPVPAGSGAVSVSAPISELPAGGTYSVRLIVTAGGATSYSETASFGTPPNPPYVAPPTPITNPNPYGCVVPVLNAYAAHPKAGQTVTITGSDLGVGGELTVGSEHPYTSAYTSTSFAVTLSATASGKVPVTLNCGHVSNTIDLTIAPPPSNTIGISHSVKGSTATLKIKVPGKGSLSASGTDLRSTNSKPSKKSTVTLKIKLGPAGTKALAKAKKHSLTLKAKVTYTPTGGTAKSTNVTLTFKS